MDPHQIVNEAMKAGASYADVRLESTTERRLEIVDREVRNFVAGEETGFNLRVLVNGAWGQSSSNDLDGASAREAVIQAVRLAGGMNAGDVTMADVPVTTARLANRGKRPAADIDTQDVLSLLLDMDKAAHAFPEVHGVTASYSDSLTRKELVTSDGTHIEWSQPRVVAQLHFTAKRDGQLSARSARVGGTTGYEIFSDDDPVARAESAARDAVAALGARTPKGGKQTVVIDPDLAGVFTHEAVGHASEADLVAAGESCFRDRLGERLGPAGLTIRDDPNIPGAFGSLPYDDDGVKAGRKTLIENGVLVGYLCDRQQAARFGIAPNGAARAQDYSYRPLVRMSNTFIEPGTASHEEVFDVKDGIYLRGSRGGQVDTARGTFLFNATDAFRIENGEITTPLRDVSLSGSILGTLHGIEAIGRDFRLGEPGYCGKGQWVPVCDGGPTLRIRDCMVGGAA